MDSQQADRESRSPCTTSSICTKRRKEDVVRL
jgi:hypothetical protein